MSGEAPSYDEIDQLEIERLIVDDLGCGSPQDARYKLDLIIVKLASVTKERDVLISALQDAISVFGEKDVTVTAERIEAWESAIDAAKGGAR